ncbi:transketolase, partial [Candidatus Woesearchaeota archaeon]|nr:transketolase [Candidatus Woesearchaeota archaeon]
NVRGLKYIRTTRPKTKVLYSNHEEFELGEFKVHPSSKQDQAIIVAAGITVHEAVKAIERLKAENIFVTLVDCYCLKPFNSKRFTDLVKKTGNKVIIVEDHYAEGGLGEMILSEVKNLDTSVEHLAIRELPHSGTKEKLMEEYSIDSKAIGRAVKKILNA